MESKSPFLSSDVRVVLRPSRNGIHTARIDPLKWRSAPLLTSGSGIHTAKIFPYILTHFRTYPRESINPLAWISKSRQNASRYWKWIAVHHSTFKGFIPVFFTVNPILNTILKTIWKHKIEHNIEHNIETKYWTNI